ncbi:membrane protein [Streptomyces albus]|uniref:Membrane protein n=1 Tax=Streptomyces albus (strain ATCC 21838 / DSM 41398 / FERM P-419 / JCM 4703 / NBRC 107858) TaxID=1081613 RepID=A0A0B5EU54_STRA4|nr:membrane protein [Streptomyces albus]AOU77083.1 membrane protein [Streptomyces albus]AYN32861.1 membrane protein [Streptomyces albus]
MATNPPSPPPSSSGQGDQTDQSRRTGQTDQSRRAGQADRTDPAPGDAPAPVPASAARREAPSSPVPPRPSGWSAWADDRLPGFRGLPPRQRAVYAALVTVVVVAGLVVAYYAAFVLDRSTARERARSDKQAERSVDREQPAFVATVTPQDYEQEVPEVITVLLDRKLTAREQAGLTALRGESARVWEFLKPLGGRLLEHPSGPVEFADSEHTRGQFRTFDLNLNSDRGAGLTVNRMTAVKDDCRAPGARTVVHLPSAGSEPRQGLLWDLTGGKEVRPRGPYALDEGASQGQLYFRQNVVELGNGQSNMAFRVQPEVSTHTCAWHIVASYTDTTGSHQQRIPSGTGTFTAEAIPARPAQYFEWVTGTGWGCIGELTQRGCGATDLL